MSDAPIGLVALVDGVVDLDSRDVRRQPPARLSPTEARLLAALARRPGTTVARAELLADVWGLPSDTTSRTLYASIQRLRKKVERDPGSPRVVLTVGRTGYRYEPPEQPLSQVDWAHPLDPFVGRADELDALGHWLHDPTAAPTLYLHGPRGIGTSRLALAFAESRRTTHHVRVVSLAGRSTLLGVMRTLASAADVTLRSDGRDARRLARILSMGRASLLVLDDAHGCAAHLPSWLGTWPEPRPRVLVVSEQAPAEPTLALGPLGLGPSGDAEALFLSRSQSRWPGWRPDAEERRGVQELVAGLHGSPLAIELAVVPSMVFGPAHALRALRGAPDDPGAAAQACIAFAWGQLQAVEQQVLQACTAFVDAVAMPRLEQLLRRLDLPLHPLARLVDVGLLELREHNGRRLRVARAASLGVPTPSEELRERMATAHAQVFGAMGSAQAIEHLVRHGSGRDYAEGSRELEDLLVAARHPSVHGAFAARRAVELLLFRGLPTMATTVATKALENGGLPPELRVWLLRKAGESLRRLGRRTEAVSQLASALQLAEQTCPESVGSVLHTRGTFEADTGDPADAEASFAAALAAHRQHGDRFREGLSLGELGTLHVRVGRHREAERHLLAALTVLREVGAPVSETIYLGNLAVAQMALQRHDVAELSLREGLDIARRLRSWRFELTHLSNLGLLAAERDDLAAARQWYEQALAVGTEDGDHMETCVTLGDFAAVALRQGELAEARRYLDLADAGFAELHLVWPSVSALLTRSALCRAEGHPSPEHALQAREIVAREGYTDLDAWCRAEQGLVALEMGNPAAADSHAVEAQELAERHQVGSRTAAGRALAELAARLSSPTPPS